MRLIIVKTGFIFNASKEWVAENLPSDKYADPAKLELIKQLLVE